MVPQLIGVPVANLRVVNGQGTAIPFQVDERMQSGEYVSPSGESPNADSGNGVFDAQDELVFLSEDADSVPPSGVQQSRPSSGKSATVTVRCGSASRYVRIIDNKELPRSSVSYIRYDHGKQTVTTPFYYARFGFNRFHFTKAGCMDFSTGKFIDLTNELRIAIALKAFWGLLPINYTEESIVCLVTRYKAGPIRLIRRGNFHLNLGLGLKGSQAIVYQMCYPELVKVPVNIHLPIKFSHFFSSAYIELTPVLRETGIPFRFNVPSVNFCEPIAGPGDRDTIIPAVPDKGYLVTDGERGYAWAMRIQCGDTSWLKGSGYTFKRPSKRTGVAECGYRLAVRDLPKGNYEIVNWVTFPKKRQGCAVHELKTELEKWEIVTGAGKFTNLLDAAGR
jgi:hypothetical protein